MTVIDAPDSHKQFYVAGGAVPVDSISYVTRRADEELYRSLLAGEFCYVLTSRQMGKSSLMYQTTLRLRAGGCRVSTIDLTHIGYARTEEQWYYSLLIELATGLEVRAELTARWDEHEALPPFHRWVAVIRSVLNERPNDRLVVCIDEIDNVLGLPFRAAEFFAGIRSCYNRRSECPELARLTFCLLGVATPSELIDDTRVTPFNIGRRIGLRDFTPNEAGPLAAGLPGSEFQRRDALARVLHWTDGHPYLTQRLCAELAESSVSSPDAVDALCSDLFLSGRASEQDDNLAFVRDRILGERTDEERGAILNLYGQILAGRRVRDGRSDRVADALLLSGAIKSELGVLTVRNRIYSEVFDRAWIARHMPDAEARRRRAAVRKARLQVGAIALVMALLAIYGFAEARIARLAERSAKALTAARDRALAASEANAREARSQAYFANMQLIQREFESGSFERIAELLRATREFEGRDVEWGYWNRIAGFQKLAFHGNVMYSARFSPDGSKILTCGNLGRLEMWDADSGNYLRLIGDQGPYMSVACCPDGSLIAAGDAGHAGTISVWEARTGKSLAVRRGHAGAVYGIQFSPDGHRFVSAGFGGDICLWDAHSWRIVRRLRRHKGVVFSVAFSPDGRRIVSGGMDHTVRLWDTASGRQLHKWERHANVYSVSFSSDGRYVLSSSADRFARIHDAHTHMEIVSLGVHTGLVRAATFSPDGRWVATASEDGVIWIWDWRARRLATSFRGHAGEIATLVYSPDGRSLLTACYDGTAGVWSTHLREYADFHAGSQYSVCARFSPDNQRIVSGGGDGVVRVWDTSCGKELGALRGHSGSIRSVMFSPDNRKVLTAGEDSTVRIWNAATGSQIAALRGHKQPVRIAAFSPNGRKLVTGSDDKTARIWDAVSGRQIALLRDHSDSVMCAEFSQAGDRIITGCGDGRARIWDTGSGALLRTLKGERGYIFSSARFSSDGSRILTGGFDHTARIWDSRTGKLITVLTGHTERLANAVWSPNGRRILTAGMDGTARLWDPASGKELLTLKGHKGGLMDAEFSPDGRRIVTAGVDGTVRIWFMGKDDFDWDTYEGDRAAADTKHPLSQCSHRSGKRLKE